MTLSEIFSRPTARLAVLVLAGAGVAVPAFAKDDTLAKIRATRTIVLGVREVARPFSYVNDQKQSVGFSVDLCLRAVDEIKRDQKLGDVRVQYKLVTGPERIPKLVDGEIDLECGSTTNTKARQEQVAFSYSFFVASMRVLSPKNIRIETIRDLNGKSIALSKGTTSEKLFTQLNGSELQAEIHTFPGNAEAYDALKTGKVQAFPQDDSLLLGLAFNDHAMDKLALSELALSVEPYAIMARKGDDALLASVDRTLARLFASGEIYALYDKWFKTDAITIRMGRLTRDSYLRPNKEPGVAILLGYSI